MGESIYSRRQKTDPRAKATAPKAEPKKEAKKESKDKE